MLLAGKTDREIVDFLVDRYGDFILYRPPLKTVTVPLWLAPFAILVFGMIFLWRLIRRRSIGAAFGNCPTASKQAPMHKEDP